MQKIFSVLLQLYILKATTWCPMLKFNFKLSNVCLLQPEMII